MLSSNDVFFKQFYLEFYNSLKENQLTEFSKQKNDFQRFEFINNMSVKLPAINVTKNCKNRDEAKLLKEKGNNAFQKSDNEMALKLYTKSLLTVPLEEGNNEVSIIRANRSAALYHLNHYHAALSDIDAALSSGYPKDLIYKIKDRKARCLLALKQNKSALMILKETLTALDDAKLPLEKKLKWQKDIQILIAMMMKNNVQDEKKVPPKKGKLNGEKNAVYNALNSSVDIKFDKTAGRYAEAKRNIELGEIFLGEEAFCSVLLDNQCDDHCYHCMKSIKSGEPCPKCNRIKFCSTKCQKIALSTYHLFECTILETLWNSGLSVTCLMALRLITQKNLHHFVELEDKLKEDVKNKIWDKNQYFNKDYLVVNQLVRHEEKRTTDALIHKTFVAVYLLRCLKETSYFKDIPNQKEQKYFSLIGGLLLRNLQFLQFNAHEIFNLKCPELDLSKSKSVFIGGGLYPTLALFNHSCNPSFVRYFEGTKVFARAIRPIKAGEMVAENYGPIFTEMEKKKRQAELKEKYWFDCKCEPCLEDWPLLKDMDMNSLRFRCENKECSSIITVPTTTLDFMVKCDDCGKHINILKGLKVLQDSEELYRLAQCFLKNGEYEKAVAKFTELLLLLDEILAPPFRDYHMCQQGLRTCYLVCGNISKL